MTFFSSRAVYCGKESCGRDSERGGGGGGERRERAEEKKRGSVIQSAKGEKWATLVD